MNAHHGVKYVQLFKLYKIIYILIQMYLIDLIIHIAIYGQRSSVCIRCIDVSTLLDYEAYIYVFFFRNLS